MSVDALALSITLSTTSAGRQPKLGAAACASVAPVALLTPGVPVVVVAEPLPEAHLVARHHLDAAHPLGALPEVEVGHEQARRAAVLGLERLAVELERHPGLAVGDVLDRQVVVVAAVADGDDVARVGVDALEQGVDGHAGPRRSELGPR